MTKMRLITEAYKMIKEEDPGSALTLNHLRAIVKSGKIPTLKSGRKTLVNYDALIEYINK